MFAPRFVFVTSTIEVDAPSARMEGHDIHMACL